MILWHALFGKRVSAVCIIINNSRTRLRSLISTLSLKGVNSQHNVLWSLPALLSIIASVCTHTKLKLQKNWHDGHFTRTFYLSNINGQEKSVLPDSHKNLEIKLCKLGFWPAAVSLGYLYCRGCSSPFGRWGISGGVMKTVCSLL